MENYRKSKKISNISVEFPCDPKNSLDSTVKTVTVGKQLAKGKMIVKRKKLSSHCCIPALPQN